MKRGSALEGLVLRVWADLVVIGLFREVDGKWEVGHLFDVDGGAGFVGWSFFLQVEQPCPLHF